jgi:phosphatidylinositol alpha-mannosyltransferase
MIRSRLKRLHGRIAVSGPAQEFASRVVPGPYEVIPNGIDLDSFTEDVAPMPEFMDGKLNILFLSRLEFRKGLNYLLNAYHRVKPEFPNSRLIVAGPGTRLRGRYERWVGKTGLQDVVFVGPVPEQDKPRYYKTADIFSVPATGRESFGVILLEAMALRKPIVATNISGYSNVVTNGEDGLLVPPRDYIQLGEALRTAMADEALRRRMGDAGRAKAERYSWDIVSQRVLDHYDRAIETARTGVS